jgi:Prolyl oligopeptidase family
MRYPSRGTNLRRVLTVGFATTLLFAASTTPSLADRGSDPSKQDDGQAQARENDTRSNDEKHEEDRRSAAIPCATDKSRSYTVDEAALPFEALAGTRATQQWGVLRGAAYRVEIPKRWNGQLVMWAHGFRGWGCDLTVDDPPMRKYLLDNGFAWAASSYASNGYNVQQGVDDTMRLLRMFKREVKRPRRVYMTGASMGGHITGVAIEQNKYTFDGAMPVCGVMGSEKLFDYFLDFNELALAVSGVSTSYPYGVDYVPNVVPEIKTALGAPTTPQYQALVAAVMQDSGGTRPGFGVAYSVWQDFLFSLGQPSPGVVPAFPASNVDTQYQLDGDPAISSDEAALNDAVRRVTRFDYETPDGQIVIPKIEGTFAIPVLTMHTIGDLFVPISMEQVYARRAADNGNSDLLVQRAIRDVGHCAFSEAEYNQAFGDLVGWVRRDVKPAGDDYLSPATVAAPTFGCTYSNNTGAFLGTPARFAFGPC